MFAKKKPFSLEFCVSVESPNLEFCKHLLMNPVLELKKYPVSTSDRFIVTLNILKCSER